MVVKYRAYGNVVEITKIEKIPSPRKVLVRPKKSLFKKPRRSDSLRRTRASCMRRLLCAIKELGVPLFFTLTFEGPASDVLYASDSLSRFQRRLHSYDSRVVSLFVPELSPRGRIHFHGFVFGLSQEWGDKVVSGRVVFYGRERRERVFAKMWKCGFIDVRQTDGSPRLASYLSKYVMKSGFSDIFSSIRLVRCSRNFPRPFEVSLLDEQWDFISSRLILDLKKEIDFSNPFFGSCVKQYYDRLV